MAAFLSLGANGGDLLSLLERAKTAGLSHERELALLAGRSAIARTIDDDGGGGNLRKSKVSPAPWEWCRHALRGALDAAETKECRR